MSTRRFASGTPPFGDDRKGVVVVGKQPHTSADEEEKEILNGFLNGKTIEQIADSRFLTVGSVNYHTKKIVNDCGAKDKTQMLTLLKKHIT